MKQLPSSFDGFPLFQSAPDIWSNLDSRTQGQALDCLALLLLRHLQQTARCAAEERPLTKGYST